MIKKISVLAGKLAPKSSLVDIPKLLKSYYNEIPDPFISTERVIFGTAGHRGSSLRRTFNEWHILAITQAICLYRKMKNINGPLFLGIDTHALSVPAFQSALEVLAANEVTVMVSDEEKYTPTPVLSFAILTHNRGNKTALADGIVITPSHNPPSDGGFKYNPPSGGPAPVETTAWIEKKANEFLETKLKGVKRVSFDKALTSDTTHYYDFRAPYISALKSVIDMEKIRQSEIHIGVNPMGGAGVHYWKYIAKYYDLNLTVINETVDPTFYFIPVDWDGQIRMDPASPFAMTNLLNMKDQFDIAFACDTDHDRHGVVTAKGGLLVPNHYLSVAAYYLFQHRKQWSSEKQIGKSIVTTEMLNRIAKNLHTHVYEVPVGFKWFSDGLLQGFLGFCCEQSAGAVFNRINGDIWTTDKDGIISGLLSAEITAVLKKDLGEVYQELESKFGRMFFKRDDAKATPEQKTILANLTLENEPISSLAGEPVESILTHAPGNHAPIGGIKIITKNGWFVARPSGTENIYEICAESFKNNEHLQQILDQAQVIVNKAFSDSKENIKE